MKPRQRRKRENNIDGDISEVEERKQRRLSETGSSIIKKPKVGKNKKKVYSNHNGDGDPKKPKKPPTAFFYFLGDFRKSFKEQNPDIKSMREIGKACGEKWNSMLFDEKVAYYDIATEKRAAFDKAMSEYIKKKESGEESEPEESDDRSIRKIMVNSNYGHRQSCCDQLDKPGVQPCAGKKPPCLFLSDDGVPVGSSHLHQSGLLHGMKSSMMRKNKPRLQPYRTVDWILTERLEGETLQPISDAGFIIHPTGAVVDVHGDHEHDHLYDNEKRYHPYCPVLVVHSLPRCFALLRTLVIIVQIGRIFYAAHDRVLCSLISNLLPPTAGCFCCCIMFL